MSVTRENFGTKLFQSLNQEHVLSGTTWEDYQEKQKASHI
jgi:hypothetical protein